MLRLPVMPHLTYEQLTERFRRCREGRQKARCFAPTDRGSGQETAVERSMLPVWIAERIPEDALLA
jgi:hypothetical protein